MLITSQGPDYVESSYKSFDFQKTNWVLQITSWDICAYIQVATFSFDNLESVHEQKVNAWASDLALEMYPSTYDSGWLDGSIVS